MGISGVGLRVPTIRGIDPKSRLGERKCTINEYGIFKGPMNWAFAVCVRLVYGRFLAGPQELSRE